MTATRDAILHSCRGTLSSSPFLFRDEWAGVIPGSKEGLYAWVAANYAADSLFARDPRHTLGVLELGGASMQVTFKVPEDQPAPPEEYTEHLHVPTVKPHESDVGTKGTNAHATGPTGDAKPGVTEITVYTHSTLGLGQEAAFASHERKLRSDGGTEDPCAPIGLDARHVYGSAGTPELKPLTPRGNFTRCVDAVVGLLGLDDPCPHERCGMKGSYLPPAIRGEMLATENFYYTARFLGLPERATIQELADAGERVCGAEWSRLKDAHLKDPAASRG